jgi:hypothetical protein
MTTEQPPDIPAGNFRFLRRRRYAPRHATAAFATAFYAATPYRRRAPPPPAAMRRCFMSPPRSSVGFIFADAAPFSRHIFEEER